MKRNNVPLCPSSLWLVAILILFWLIPGCATVSTKKPSSYREPASVAKKGFSFPPYSGPKTRIQVVRFGIPKEVLDRYQELADKRVGWGLCNRIVEGFWATNRFEYLEEKEEIFNRMVRQWQLSEAGGIVAEETAVGLGALKAPQYLVYAEVYDFGVSRSETVVGMGVKETNTTIVGVQIRMVDIATGSYIPASAIGEAKTTGMAIWADVDMDFDQTTVGLASQDAVEKAIRILLDRMP